MTTHVVLSGGLDSTACLAQLADNAPDAVVAVSFDYGQRHRRELGAAATVAGWFSVEHRIIDLTGLLHGSALLGATKVPEGHYAADTMAATVVQGRNLLFAAAAIAGTNPGDTVAFGVHAGDHPIYPDCRPPFWLAVADAVAAYEVVVVTPFIERTKAEVVRIGSHHRAPFQLTWSCYVGGERHCGRCGTCVERAEAFHLADIEDPTQYEDDSYWKAVTA